MKHAVLAGSAGALALLAAVAPVFAHHSTEFEFDKTMPVTVTGTVTRVGWTNPHVWFCLDVPDDGGAVARWQFESAPPTAMRRRFGDREPLKLGDRITVQGIMAKEPVQDGVRTAAANTITLSDGRSASVGGDGWTSQVLFFDPARSQCNQAPN